MKPAAAATLVTKDFLSILDLSHVELQLVLDLAASMKRDRTAGRVDRPALARRHVALLFEKPSLRTRLTFIVAVHELGGHIIEPPADSAFGGREAVEDVARNIERWVAGVVARTFEQARLAAFAAAAPGLHVINALTNEEHPCQALADMLTLRERLGTLTGRTLAYVGDGNNVATSLAHASAMLGLTLRIASPKGFELSAETLAACREVAADGGTITQTPDPFEAVAGADAVYTDVWTSMGQEAERSARSRAFQPYQVNGALMAAARPEARFMHCRPAHRGDEVTAAVIDSPMSMVFEQAENRLHTQKALLALLIGRDS
jgi:ornithine carbamoyltransferase